MVRRDDRGYQRQAIPRLRQPRPVEPGKNLLRRLDHARKQPERLVEFGGIGIGQVELEDGLRRAGHRVGVVVRSCGLCRGVLALQVHSAPSVLVLLSCNIMFETFPDPCSRFTVSEHDESISCKA